MIFINSGYEKNNYEDFDDMVEHEKEQGKCTCVPFDEVT